jgi:hypothetical protein
MRANQSLARNTNQNNALPLLLARKNLVIEPEDRCISLAGAKGFTAIGATRLFFLLRDAG